MLRNLHDEGAALRQDADEACFAELDECFPDRRAADIEPIGDLLFGKHLAGLDLHRHDGIAQRARHLPRDGFSGSAETRSEEHTSELQSLMRISYAVF